MSISTCAVNGRALALGLVCTLAFPIVAAAQDKSDESGPIIITPRVAAGNADGQPASPPPAPEEGGILIAPGPSSMPPAPAEAAAPRPDARGYAATYDAIPFSRTEYNANPSYRHDSTMEMLFGQLRPMTIIKNDQGMPPMDQGIGYYQAGPYYNGYGAGPYYNYNGWRTNNLNFWYPIPSVYRHW